MLNCRWKTLIQRPRYALSVWPVKSGYLLSKAFTVTLNWPKLSLNLGTLCGILLDSIGSWKVCALTPLESFAELLCGHASSTPQDSFMAYILTFLTLRVKLRTSRAISSSSSTPSGSRSSSVSTSAHGECSRPESPPFFLALCFFFLGASS